MFNVFNCANVLMFTTLETLTFRAMFAIRLPWVPLVRDYGSKPNSSTQKQAPFYSVELTPRLRQRSFWKFLMPNFCQINVKWNMKKYLTAELCEYSDQLDKPFEKNKIKSSWNSKIISKASNSCINQSMKYPQMYSYTGRSTIFFKQTNRAGFRFLELLFQFQKV